MLQLGMYFIWEFMFPNGLTSRSGSFRIASLCEMRRIIDRLKNEYLDHEVPDGTVELHIVVISILTVRQEILARKWNHISMNLLA